MLRAAHNAACTRGTLLRPRAAQETELVAAGFPCIDLSRAGLRNGINGQVHARAHARTQCSSAPHEGGSLR